jgi:hypothetical protein
VQAELSRARYSGVTAPRKETKMGLQTPETERIDVPRPEPLEIPTLEPSREPAHVEVVR